VNRAVLWLVVGLLGLVLGVFAIAPELLGGAMLGPLAVAVGAIVPAALVAALFVSTRRRRRDHATHDPGA
jgi:uncharacterized membrane-anchored protein